MYWLLLVCLVSALVLQHTRLHTPARFVFEYPPASDQFVIELIDESKIQEARNILNGTEKDQTHVFGRIIKRPDPYNPKWSYQLDPASISFFNVAIEVCDAPIRYVEDHLDEAGGAFLPGGLWCPWNSRLVKEIQ